MIRNDKKQEMPFFSPPAETGPGFVCKSVMYYYKEMECILNTETRTSKPNLFIKEGPGFSVDYFDITCLNGKPYFLINRQKLFILSNH